jgi:hypothetical protein
VISSVRQIKIRSTSGASVATDNQSLSTTYGAERSIALDDLAIVFAVLATLVWAIFTWKGSDIASEIIYPGLFAFVFYALALAGAFSRIKEKRGSLVRAIALAIPCLFFFICYFLPFCVFIIPTLTF